MKFGYSNHTHMACTCAYFFYPQIPRLRATSVYFRFIYKYIYAQSPDHLLITRLDIKSTTIRIEIYFISGNYRLSFFKSSRCKKLNENILKVLFSPLSLTPNKNSLKCLRHFKGMLHTLRGY